MWTGVYNSIQAEQETTFPQESHAVNKLPYHIVSVGSAHGRNQKELDRKLPTYYIPDKSWEMLEELVLVVVLKTMVVVAQSAGPSKGERQIPKILRAHLYNPPSSFLSFNFLLLHTGILSFQIVFYQLNYHFVIN